MDSFQEKYNALVIKYNALLAENEELKSILSQHGIVYSSIKRADESTAFSSIIYPPDFFYYYTTLSKKSNAACNDRRIMLK